MKKHLTDKETKELIKEWRETGNREARDKIILANLGLVYKITPSYLGRGMDLEDLFQVGVIGLIMALETYDCQRGTKFTTWAYQYIKGYIRRAIETKGTLIRIGHRITDLLAKIQRESDRFYSEHGRYPTIEEISCLLGIKEKQLRYTMQYEDIAKDNHYFIDATFKEDDDGPDKHRFLEDKDIEEPCIYSTKELAEILEAKMKNKLTVRQQEVLRLYLGLDDGIPKTYNETAKVLGITCSGVEQVVKNALRRLIKQ